MQGSLKSIFAFTQATRPYAFLHGVTLSLLLVLILWGISSLSAHKQIQIREAQLAHETISIASVKPDDVIIEEKEIPKKTAPKQEIRRKDSSLSLPAAPIQAVAEDYKGKILPVISLGGLTPYDAYKKQIPLPQGKQTVVALALTGYGQSKTTSAEAVKNIPNTITLLTSPYISNLQTEIDVARKYGFETWLNLPVQSKSYPRVDTGNKTILLHSSLQLNLDHTIWAMTKASGYAGVYSRFDGTFSYSKNMIKDLFSYIFSRGVAYFESSQLGNASIESTAIVQNAPYIKSDLNIETIQDIYKIKDFIPAAIKQQTSVITLPLSPNLLQEIPAIIKTLQDHDIKIMPLSAIYDYRWKTKQ